MNLRSLLTNPFGLFSGASKSKDSTKFIIPVAVLKEAVSPLMEDTLQTGEEKSVSAAYREIVDLIETGHNTTIFNEETRNEGYAVLGRGLLLIGQELSENPDAMTLAIDHNTLVDVRQGLGNLDDTTQKFIKYENPLDDPKVASIRGPFFASSVLEGMSQQERDAAIEKLDNLAEHVERYLLPHLPSEKIFIPNEDDYLPQDNVHREGWDL